MTGEEGCHADRRIRRLLTEGRYRFLASDMHGLDTLDRLTVEAPLALLGLGGTA